jgi:hypothetical protein
MYDDSMGNIPSQLDLTVIARGHKGLESWLRLGDTGVR